MQAIQPILAPAVAPPLRLRLERVLAPVDAWFDRLYGARHNPLHQTGALAVGLLLVMLASGLYLLIFYKIGAPHDSVAEIQAQAWAGRWIRALHRYSADAAMGAVGLHMLRMFAQGRTWGPRALAWITGLFLLGMLFVCGWTGLVMIWDAQAVLVATQGARLLDLLPIFSEPIGRVFQRSLGVGRAFFFLNLFAHIAIPLALALCLWVHTMRVARPVFLPPRRLWWGVVAVLAGFAVLFPAPLPPKIETFELAGAYRLDWFFAFWVPYSLAVPAWVHALTWASGAAFLASIPWWWRPRPEVRREPSFVDERFCTGCTQCAIDCPYEAIAMVPRGIGTGSEIVARVDPNLCVSCGICAGSCAPMEIGPPFRNGKGQWKSAQRYWNEDKPPAGEVVVITCSNGVNGHRALRALAGVRTLGANCAGAVHTSTLEYLLRRGAAGVYVLACAERNCVFREGPRWLGDRLFHDREAELQPRVDKRRVRLGSFGYGSARAAAKDVRAFQQSLAASSHPALDEGDAAPEAECEPPARAANDA
jgi:ferredoxin